MREVRLVGPSPNPVAIDWSTKEPLLSVLSIKRNGRYKSVRQLHRYGGVVRFINDGDQIKGQE